MASTERPKVGFWDRVLVRFRRKRLIHWELRYLEAHGRMLDIEKGQDGVTWRGVMWDRTEAENNVAYYRSKINAVDSGKAP